MNTVLKFAAAAVLMTAVCSPISKAATDGEASAVLVCFYECKDGADQRVWQEVTSLMLANMGAPGPFSGLPGASVRLAILDGNQNIIARSFVGMSDEDLDEINICRTLFDAGVPVPPAGLVEVVVRDPLLPAPGQPAFKPGVYGWVKNVTGKFFKTVDDPFRGRVSSVGKTECRIVPPEVLNPQRLQDKIDQSTAPDVAAILIEDTGNDGPSPF